MSVRPIALPEGTAIGVEVELHRTHLAILAAPGGYLMCGALDVHLLDEKLGSRAIVAGRALGVKTVDDLLEAPLESVTAAARRMGVAPGMKGEDAIRIFLRA